MPDVGRLLRGEASLTTAERLLVASAVTGEEHAATREDLAALLEVPVAHWVVPAEVGLEESRANAFTERGWVLREDDAEGRLRDDAPGAARWNAHAAMYHGLTRWRGVETRQELPVVDSAELAELARTGAAELVRRYGRPPPAFVERAGGPVFELPLPGPTNAGLWRTLSQRRTTRAFDRDAVLGTAQLAGVLYWGFGCQGLAHVTDELELVRRASPSGGGLHPIEACVLVARVEGVEPGLYHYRARDHALELLQALDEQGVRALALRFVAGQEYFVDAQALCVLSARFERSYWRYRDNNRAYAVVLMDAAHISQTFYLACTELGLGAFVTAAVNVAEIDEALGLDGFREGALAICGCGIPATARPGLEPEFQPYAPRGR